MFGFRKLTFEGLIMEIQEDSAKVGMIDAEGGKSWLEISVDDLKKNKIQCKSGCIFSFILVSWFKWERIFMFPIKKIVLSTKDFDLLKDFYKKEYGNV